MINGQCYVPFLIWPDVEIGEIMVHRKNVAMIDADEPVETIIDEVLNSPYTRLPVYKGDTDNIVGVLHAKALLRELRANAGIHAHIDIAALAAEPWFVPRCNDPV
jgi:Mg2+/Co2+ transporter CorB